MIPYNTWQRKLQDNKRLHGEFDLCFSSMYCQLGEPWFRLFWSCTRDRNALYGLFNDETGSRNSVELCFQMNLSFVYSIIIVKSTFSASKRTHYTIMHSVSFSWPITWSYRMRYYCICVLVASCSNRHLFEWTIVLIIFATTQNTERSVFE